VALYNQTRRERGIIKGEPAKFIHGHNARGRFAHNWKEGRRSDSRGYVRLRSERVSRGWEYEHRLVMEAVIGRALGRHEVVHHRNADRSDNSPENLELMSQSEHAGLEGRGRSLSDQARKNISEGVTRWWAERKSQSAEYVI
jgi:hypothetical protein